MKIKEDDLIIISISDDKKWMVKVEAGKEFHTHKGPVVLDEVIGLEYGSSIVNSKDATFFLWKPSPYDYRDAITHSTQVIYQTDIAQIIFTAGICSGVRVIEAGTGSGSLTSALARYVFPGGKVFSYDFKEKHQKVARKNIEKLGLSEAVDFKIKDVTTGFDEKDVEAVILDMPNPWDVIEHARDALMGGGKLVIFVPTYTQVDQSLAKLVENNFYQIEAFEVIRRDLTTRIGAIRPATRMIGFTAFLVVARKGFSLSEER